MTLTDIGIIAAAGVGVWTATNAVINGAVAANERRDTVLLGYVKDRPLTYEHRELILYNDWLPMTVGIALLSVAASSAAIVLPWFLIDKSLYAGPVSIVGCLMFLLVARSQLMGGIKEFRVMKSALDEARPRAQQI
jgi:hypothetical protein